MMAARFGRFHTTARAYAAVTAYCIVIPVHHHGGTNGTSQNDTQVAALE